MKFDREMEDAYDAMADRATVIYNRQQWSIDPVDMALHRMQIVEALDALGLEKKR